jgi:hypothetical protein
LKIRTKPGTAFDLPDVLMNAESQVIAPDAVLLDISDGGCGLKVLV